MQKSRQSFKAFSLSGKSLECWTLSPSMSFVWQDRRRRISCWVMELVLGFKWIYFWLFVAEEKSAKSWNTHINVFWFIFGKMDLLNARMWEMGILVSFKGTSQETVILTLWWFIPSPWISLTLFVFLLLFWTECCSKWIHSHFQLLNHIHVRWVLNFFIPNYQHTYVLPWINYASGKRGTS